MTHFTHDEPPPPVSLDPSDGHDPFNPAEDIWTVARDLYTSGQTGQAVCLALGIRPSTFWRRAAHENWLRRDQPRGSAPIEPLDMSASVDDLPNAQDKAWRRVCVAMDQGRSAEAMRWIRVHAALSAQTRIQREIIDRSANRQTQDEQDEQDEPTHVALRDARTKLERVVLAIGAGNRLDKVESTLTDSHAARPADGLDPDAPGLSRGERRRRLKYRAAHRPRTSSSADAPNASP